MMKIQKIFQIQELFPFSCPSHRILGIFAHPDDESLLMGGTFALAHEAGIPSALITVTQGEQGGKFSGVFGKKLAVMREREWQNATDILHITAKYHLKFPDQGVWKNRVHVIDHFVQIISQQKPTIIVTHDMLDISQHPDHIATAQAVIEAVHRIQSTWPHIVLYASLTPHKARRTYALDIDAFRNLKIQACSAHVSQGLFRGVKMSVPIDVYYALNHFEYFFPA